VDETVAVVAGAGYICPSLYVFQGGHYYYQSAELILDFIISAAPSPASNHNPIPNSNHNLAVTLTLTI